MPWVESRLHITVAILCLVVEGVEGVTFEKSYGSFGADEITSDGTPGINHF